MTGSTLVIVNRAGGTAGDRNRLRQAIDRLDRAGLEPELHAPEEPAEITELVRHRGPNARRIVLGGGDGTFVHTAPALLEAGRPFGILPMGTANDLARTLGIPFDLDAAAAIVAAGRLRRIDLGTVNGRPYFNVASIGFSARVALHHAGERKRHLKLLSYPLSWLDAQRDFTPFPVTLRYDGRRRRTRATMLAVGNGVHYGGGLTIVDNAAIDDGWLDVFYVRPVGPLRMLRLLPRLKFGAIRRRRDIRTLRVRWIGVETDTPEDVNVDGELLERTPAEFGLLPNALEVYVPAPT